MATMDPASKLSRLAATSVPGLGSAENLPRTRSFKELRESLNGAAAATTTTIPPQTTTANPFLANLPTLRTNSNVAPTTRATGEKSAQAGGSRKTSPEERIDDHFQRLFSKYMHQEQEQSRRIVDELCEKRKQKSHQERMKRYLDNLHGKRTLGGSSNVPISSTYAPLVGLTTTPVQDDLDRATVGPFLDVVYRWNRSRQEPLEQVLRAFQNLGSPADSSAWRLLDNLIARQEVGALSYYCHQFQEICKTKVRTASTVGQDISTPYSLSHGMAKIVASYVKLTTNNTSSPWPIVYYCLRCGDATAALHVMDATNIQVDPSLRQIVSLLSQAQGNLSCVWDASVPPAISDSIRQAVTSLYQRSKDSPDPYYVATLALLSATDLDTILSSSVVSTTEDYMFGNLWFALQQAFPPTAIKELANNIKQLGPASFPKDTEWGYALPLLAAQQYHTALTHIAKTNLLQATHMALVLDAANVDVGATPLATSLILEYANKLQQKDAFAAAEYLVRIPRERLAQSEVARVVVESQQPDAFVARLQELFMDKASAVLVEAAEHARSRGYCDMAAHLFFRANRFDLLLSLLNDQLASEMANGMDRIEWRNKALAFHSENVASGKEIQIQSVLEETGTKDRLETFQILLEINRAFLLVQDKDYERARENLDRLPLLPSSEAYCNVKASQYSSLDPAIKKVFPMMLEKYFECLSQLYAQLKSIYGQSTGQQQESLRSRAQMLLFQFVGAIQTQLPADSVTRMNVLERSMM